MGDGHLKGWPEPYIHTVYDRMYGDFPAKITVYTHTVYTYKCMVLANPSHLLLILEVCRGV